MTKANPANSSAIKSIIEVKIKEYLSSFPRHLKFLNFKEKSFMGAFITVTMKTEKPTRK
jgi:hypothetical protein